MQLRTDTIAPALKPCRTIIFFKWSKQACLVMEIP